jgi:alkaline phosphatase
MKKVHPFILLIGLCLIIGQGWGPTVAMAQENYPFNYYLPVVFKEKVVSINQWNLASTSGTVPLTLLFDGSESTAANGTAVDFQWYFGDGQKGQGVKVSHTFTEPGIYLVGLEVIDSSGTGIVSFQPIWVYAPAFGSKNVILFIGDGMGIEHVKAAGYYLHGAEGMLPFESFPYRADMTTSSQSPSVTDSAAASTAMATGYKVNNSVIGRAVPGDGRDLYNVLEYARDQRMSTGLVSTATITHATPAGFGAHAADRSQSSEIASDYLTGSRPNVLFGGGGDGMSVPAAQSAGYTIVGSWADLSALNTETVEYVSGQFGNGPMPYMVDGMGILPTLSQMTEKALAILDNDLDGFFLMVEGAKIDYASHQNDTQRTVGETVEFSRAVQKALDWAAANPNTIILVLADHETGGLTVVSSNGAGNLPNVNWSTTGHTGVNVPVYAYGFDFDSFPTLLDNTQIPSLISGGKFKAP